MRHYPEIGGQYHADFVNLAEVFPAATSAISGLLMEAPRQAALSGEFEELIAFAIAITARYEDSTFHRSQVVIKPGVTRPETIEMIGVELRMEGGPSMLRDVETVVTEDRFASMKQWNLTARVLMCFEIKNPIEL